LGPAFDADVESFDLSADGRTLACFVNEEGSSVLHLLNPLTGVEERRVSLPAGVAAGLRWHPRRREIAFTLASSSSPGDVYSVSQRGRVTRWTRSASGHLRPENFRTPTLVRVRSFDGLPLSGFLYPPDPQRFPGPRPVLMIVHGGPESQSRPGFQSRWNYLLEELGVALLYPNVRGSAGYGKRLLTLDNGVRREDAVRDVGVFLDWLAREPRLDRQRVAAYGASYGGYLVLASAAHFGERLRCAIDRCAIDVVGISSFPTFLKNTQDYRSDLRRAEYGDERDPVMAEFLHRISPLTQAHRIRTPLLIGQGKNDPRVPVTESEQMVRALRAQGGEVWYVLAKDEGRGFARKRNSDFLFLTMVQFLQTHLLP
jgi:dipeptidyl aminopeptidase/acylaminoacyl peptidase